MIKDVLLTRLNIIRTPGGDVLHAMKNDSPGFVNFGEAYFSEIQPNVIKGWKRHRNMTLNLVVPIGKVQFVLFDDRKSDNIQFQKIIISRENYCRLTIPPMIWMGFKGLSKKDSMLLNIANIRHRPEEVDKKNIDEIDFDWEF